MPCTWCSRVAGATAAEAGLGGLHRHGRRRGIARRDAQRSEAPRRHPLCLHSSIWPSAPLFPGGTWSSPSGHGARGTMPVAGCARAGGGIDGPRRRGAAAWSGGGPAAVARGGASRTNTDPRHPAAPVPMSPAEEGLRLPRVPRQPASAAARPASMQCTPCIAVVNARHEINSVPETARNALWKKEGRQAAASTRCAQTAVCRRGGARLAADVSGTMSRRPSSVVLLHLQTTDASPSGWTSVC